MPKRSSEFQRDRDFLLYWSNQYANADNSAPNVDALHQQVSADLATNRDFKAALNLALEKLEALRDARSGISLSVVKGNYSEAPVVIRDKRRALVPATKGCESYIMQFLNFISAAQEILEIEGKNKLALESELRRRALNFFDKLKDSPQEGAHGKVQDEMEKLALFLKDQGVKDAGKKLDLAIDFQSFNRPHHNVATISQIKKGDKVFVITEAEVAATALSHDQRTQFDRLLENEKIWEFERQLMRKHQDAIFDGQHVIPSRKHSLPGTPFFEKVTLLGEKDPALAAIKSEEISSTPNCASIVSFCSDKAQRKKMTAQNFAQVQTFYPQTTLHLNLLNAKSRRPDSSTDREIVLATQALSKDVNVTVSCANSLRRFPAANDMSGVNRYLGKIAQAIDPQSVDPNHKNADKQRKILTQLREHLAPAPKGFFAAIKKTMKDWSAPSGVKILKDLKRVNFEGAGADDMRAMMAEAISLKKKVKKLESFRFFDSQNASLEVSEGLAALSKKIEKLDEHGLKLTTVGINEVQLPRELPVVTCTRGRDRTRITTQDRSARAIARETKIGIKEVDAVLSNVSSAEFMAGSCLVGAGVAGHFGIKAGIRGNEGVLPKSRKGNLMNLLSEEADRYSPPGLMVSQRVSKALHSEPEPKQMRIIADGPPIVVTDASHFASGRNVHGGRPTTSRGEGR